jgi:hypothetical protein
MEMSISEIKKSYSNAKNQKKQIRILADLNDCTADEIEAIVKSKEPSRMPDTPQKNDLEILERWIYKKMDILDKQIRQMEKEYSNYAAALKAISEFRKIHCSITEN